MQFLHIPNRPTKKGLGILQLLTLSCLIILLVIPSTQGQETEGMPDRPVRSSFASQLLIDQQTVDVPFTGTFEFDIMHRFGTLQNGYDDLYGLYSNSNIRLGFSYVARENLQVGLGLTKFKHMLDLNLKYALLRQTMSDRTPVSITYYGNIGIDTRPEDNRGEVFNTSDRYSYFHKVMVARKFNDWLTLQLAPSLSHFNIINEEMDNDHIAVSFAGQLKVKGTTYLIVGIDQPITQHTRNNPNPNLSLGVQFTSSSHAFQIFVGNYNSIVPQENHVFNSNDWEDGFKDNFLIGFNITRLWNF